MKYTKRQSQTVKAIPKPHGLKWDLVEYDSFPPFLALRFYESQWAMLTEGQRYDCVIYLIQIKKVLENFGHRVTLDPVIDITEVPKGGFKE
jgi:hypothetical protein